MESRHLLLAYVLLIHTLTSTMWLIGGKGMGLSRNAAQDWMRASVAGGAALAMLLLDGGSRSAGDVMIACTLGVLAATSTQRGMQYFLRVPHRSRHYLVVTAAAALFNLGLCWPMNWPTAGLAMSCLLLCGILLQTLTQCYGPISREFRPATANTVAVQINLLIFVFSVAAAVSVIDQYDLMPLPSPELRQFALVFVCMGLSVTMTFVLGYIVVMRLVYRLQHLSQHDSLTGLLNRRAIEQAMAREVHRLQRFQEPFSVLLVDIDHFKRINDQLGHAAGDAVLQAVAGILQAQAREVDRVARFGGEEFCILLPHTTEEGALQAAERFRAAVHETDITWQDERIAVTISTGLACAVRPGESQDRLLRRADEALYQAKRDGRNRVVLAELITTA